MDGIELAGAIAFLTLVGLTVYIHFGILAYEVLTTGFNFEVITDYQKARVTTYAALWPFTALYGAYQAVRWYLRAIRKPKEDPGIPEARVTKGGRS